MVLMLLLYVYCYILFVEVVISCLINWYLCVGIYIYI